LHDLAASGADEAIEAEDLALAQLEGDVVELGRMRQAGDLEQRAAELRLALREDGVDGAPDHHADDVALLGLREQAFADHLSVAEHGVAVGDAIDLVELVADEQDRLAL